jgi:hypothetical protein
MELTLVKLRMGTMQEIMDSPELQKVAATVLEETVRARVVVQKVAVPPEMVILQGVVGAATDI